MSTYLSDLSPGIGRSQALVMGVIGRPITSYFSLDVEGIEHVPSRGPAILAMNHDSLLDIPILVAASPRPVLFMGKAELFDRALSSRFFHELGGFPVRRGSADLRAVRAALEVVRRGRLLGMYPEGTRGPTLRQFLPGAAWVSLKTGAPLIPVGINGTAKSMPSGSPVPRRTRVRIRFGEPIRSGREEKPRARLQRTRELTQQLRSAVEDLILS